MQPFTLNKIIYLLQSNMNYESTNSKLITRLLDYTQNKQISVDGSWEIHSKILTEIQSGLLPISSSGRDCQSYINLKIKQAALQDIYNSDDYYNYERDMQILQGLSVSVNLQERKIEKPRRIRNRKKIIIEQESINNKRSEQEIKKQFLQKIKNWELEKSKIIKRKQEQQNKKKKLEMSCEDKKKKEDQQIHNFLKLEKQKIIEGRIKEIEHRKLKRDQILHESSVKKAHSLPKFIEVESNFKNAEKQKEIQQKILLKNRKADLQLKMEQIKQHQKAYIQRIKERLNIKSQSKNIQLSQSNDSINHNKDNININRRDPLEIKKMEEKIKKMKKFQEKIRLVPLKINEEKKKEIDIIGDKLKNSKKYHFLSQKALSDQQIYDQFKDFDINIDNRQIGNKYFEEVKEINKLKKRKVSSQKVLPNKAEYKDYLKQIRQKQKDMMNPDEFDNIAKKLNKQKNKSPGKEYLLKKSAQYQDKVFQKIKELKQIANYQDSIRKQQQIDKNFMKAIQAKLAYAKIG